MENQLVHPAGIILVLQKIKHTSVYFIKHLNPAKLPLYSYVGSDKMKQKEGISSPLLFKAAHASIM